jgi:hydroxymethylbilane synthase
VSGRVVIGTRGSALARWQAEHIAAALRAAHPGLTVDITIIVTEGDRRSERLGDRPEPEAPAATGPQARVGKGLWVEEIENALLEKRVDLAVHSLKDVPAALAPGLVLAAIPPRADPRDALVSRAGVTLAALPAGARVGTSSLRRVCQLRQARPDLVLEIFRGNVDTRLRKVAAGVVDAALLACAGLDRLGHGARISERFPVDRMVPAIGQGALALEIRGDDDTVRGLCRALADPAAEATVAAERALLVRLDAGCKTPVAGHARVVGDRLELEALVGRPDGSEILREKLAGPIADAAALGTAAADRLLARGAAEILAALEK